MGRPKAFDRTNVLEKAMQVFWRQGYEATSLQDLVEAMGINRFSIYAEFGDKRGLFLSALDYYDADRVTSTLGSLDREDASLADIRAFFERLAHAATTPYASQGCLVCNTMAECTTTDMDIATRSKHYVTRLRSVFRRALRHAQQRGELPATASLDTLADYLTGAVIGLFGYMKSPAPPQAVQGYAQTVLQALT
ncbi:MAG: TetR/AcrR family transcriptional regulator [Rhodothermales bacterium]